MVSLITRNATGKVLVRLEDADGIGITGVAHTGITEARLSKNNAASASFTLTASNWVEIGNGFYSVTLAAVTDTGTEGPGLLIIRYAGQESGWVFYVRDRDEGDVYDFVSAVDQSLTTLSNVVIAYGDRTLALTQDNVYIDSQVYSGANLTSCRIRAYNSKANAEAHGATGLLYTYLMTATYSGANLTSYLLTRDA